MHLVRWLGPFFAGLSLGVIAMMLHECGHLAAALALNVRVKKIGLEWNKGLYTVRERGTNSQNLLIALAGPSVNLLLMIAAPWFPVFGLANLCYALANLLPIEGSDGFRVASCWRRFRSAESAN